MLVELLGPYRDKTTGKTPDEDLIRIGLSRHRIAKSRKVVGHCRYSDGSILLFPLYDQDGNDLLSERDRTEITNWTKDLISDHQQNANAG